MESNKQADKQKAKNKKQEQKLKNSTIYISEKDKK